MQFKKFLSLLFIILTVIIVTGCQDVNDGGTTTLPVNTTGGTSIVDDKDPKPTVPTLVVHYKRYNKDYSAWNLWIWQNEPNNSSGQIYNFTTEDDFGKIARVPLQGDFKDATSLGIIVRTNDWVKDVDADRFIDVSTLDENNEIHVWLTQGEMDINYSTGGIDVSPKVLSASFKNMKTINFTTSEKIPFNAEVKVYRGETEVSVAEYNFGITAKSGRVILTNNIQLGEKYRVVIDGFNDRVVNIYNLYDTPEFEVAYTYLGNDLGLTYTHSMSKFRLWAPTANAVSVNIYTSGDPRQNDLEETVPMTSSVNGTWVLELPGDYQGKYYTYRVTNDGKTQEAIDPYSFSLGVNGSRSMILDMNTTNPEGWNLTSRPVMVNREDAIIYELHIRDLSIDQTSGVSPEYKGKYLGLTETGTNYNGVKTGLDHLIDLGITHLHLLPAFDHRSINEFNLSTPQFNWGYDPHNFNSPEGSYSTDPYNGEVRVKEFKQMVKALHDNGIRVVMDVVYNHTGATGDSELNKIVPNYYYRMNPNGSFSNGSGTGNETASERSMMRKFMVDSVNYWATEYQIDGFRFDLMALHDIKTMNEIRQSLDIIDPSIIVYGEGWTGGSTPLPYHEQAVKTNAPHMPGIAVFNDDTRNGIRGHNDLGRGLVQGENVAENIKFGIAGAVQHDQINLGYVTTDIFWALDPEQTINYASAHDNYTLWDQINLSMGNTATIEQKILMHKQANAIVLTSQGTPFLHAGVDFLRTKDGNHNSYNASDAVNALDWARKAEYMDVYNYYKGLIALRKAHPGFRMTIAEDIRNHLSFMPYDRYVLGYTINNAPNETWNNIVVLFNTSNEYKTVIMDGTWNIVVNEQRAGTDVIDTVSGQITIAPHGTIVAYKSN